jgi:hypothetical protein
MINRSVTTRQLATLTAILPVANLTIDQCFFAVSGDCFARPFLPMAPAPRICFKLQLVSFKRFAITERDDVVGPLVFCPARFT